MTPRSRLAAFASLLAVAVAAPARAQGPADEPRLWAVIVRVERYRAPIAPRPGPRNEGRRLAAWVQGPAGWGPENVLELSDEGGDPPNDPSARHAPLLPTRKNLDYALKDWLGARVKEKRGDVVVFSFAGRGDGSAPGAPILPIDFRQGDPGWSPEPWVERMIRDFKCSAVLSWLDLTLAGPPEAGDRLLRRLARWPGSSAWLATDDRGPGAAGGFAPALREALGDGRRPLLAAFSDLDRGAGAGGYRLRQLGGIPPELALKRGLLAAPGRGKAELLIQKGHADRVGGLLFRADGKAMISAGDDSTLRVWDPSAPEKALLRVLPDFLNGVTAQAISPDGRHLAGGDGMGSVRAWDLSGSDGRAIARDGPEAHKSLVKALAFLPDGPPGTAPPARFVTLGQEDGARIWTIAGRALQVEPITVPGEPRGLLLAAATRPGGPSAFALIGEDGQLRAFDRSGRPTRTVTLAGARPTALRLDAEGRRAIVGDDSGRLRVVDLAKGPGEVTLDRQEPARPVSAIAIGAGGLAAVASGGGISLLTPDRPGPVARLELGDDPATAVEFSPDGGRLAALTRDGSVGLWDLGGDQAPRPLRLDRLGGGPPRFSSIAFGPASSPPMLAAGEADGGIRRWDLARLRESPRIAPYRGRVARLGVTPDGRSLLQLTRDGIAQVWDLREGRVVRTLAGTWAAGAFLPGGRLAMARTPDDGGGVAVVDAREGRPVPGVELRPAEGSPGDFARVVASKDGRRVAASDSPGRGEEVVLWEVGKDGPPATFHPHGDAEVAALELSDDGKTLLTAGSDGSVKLWDLAAPGEPKLRAEYREPTLRRVTAAAFGPGDRVVAAGETDDDPAAVFAWSGRVPGPARKLGSLAGRVLSVALAGEGRYAIAAGQGRRLRAWDLAAFPDVAAVDVLVAPPGRSGPEPAHHHSESINDLRAWPTADGPSLASGSDDATVRLWRVEPGDRGGRKPTLRLMATIASAPEEPIAPPPAAAKGRQAARPARVDSPWVVFTPEGVYDSSLEGERLVSFSDGRGVAPLDQYAARLFHPLLADQIRQGKPAPPNEYRQPPPLLIDAGDDQPPDRAEAEIRVSLGDLKEIDPGGLRLYQNGAPVRDGSGFRKVGLGEYSAKVPLVHGDNRIYAMAGRLDDVDARSADLVLYHAPPGRPGRLHVVALGVGRYLRNALLYPVADARQIADFVQGHSLGAGKEPGEKIVLADEDVDAAKVQGAFDKLRSRVKDHPEDTVVVFLAGHTDLLAAADGQPRYSLLLSKFPFPEGDPARAVLRGPNLGFQVRQAKPGTFLPYASIYRNLATLDALRRIIIVDACQAEAILDDPGVRQAEQVKAMERESRRTTPSYFLASRRGEAAEEASELKHGLLTYVMLRGMGAPDLEPPPADVAPLRENLDADLDADGVVTTRELHRYVDLALAPLADRLPGRVRAPRAADLAPLGPPKIQAGGPSFPLVVLPRRTAVAGLP